MSVIMRCACLILVFTVNVLTVVQCQDYFDYDSETRPCQLKNGKSGICKPLNNCPSVIEALKRRERPVNCWYNRNGPVVCCGVSENLAESKSEAICGRYYKRKSKNRYWYGGAADGLIGGIKSSPREFTHMNNWWDAAELFTSHTYHFVECMELHKRREKRSSDDENNRYEIVGGVEALSRQFKHMAILGYGDEDEKSWACGGSLISEKFVLTAAHCVNTKELGEVKFVRLGDLNIKDERDDAEPQDFKVTRRIRHPQYKPPSQYHDIALLELDRPVKISAHVKPACIHTSRKIEDPVWIATGWGRVEFGGESADHLQRVDLREFTIDECNTYYTANRRLVNGITDSSQICAGDKNKDTCQGDSGGPLQIRNPDYAGSYRIIGVTSFGKACGISTSPGIYTRVSNYVDWIESIVWPN